MQEFINPSLIILNCELNGESPVIVICFKLVFLWAKLKNGTEPAGYNIIHSKKLFAFCVPTYLALRTLLSPN